MKFVYYVLKNMNLQRFDTGSANPTLNRNIVHPEPVAFPPHDEQLLIAAFLDKNSEQVDSLIQRSLCEINLICKYRTRLISDVVTGKIDVRDIPIEAVPEDEALEEFIESEMSDEHVETNEQEII